VTVEALEGDSSREGPIVITVHGTFAADLTDEGSRWWQRGSQFTSALVEALAERGFPDVSVRPFRWSGLNSDYERLQAARELAKTIATASDGHRPVAVLAHSHGGNVLMEALVQRAVRNPLSAVLTLGTPFFTRRLKPIPTLIAAFKILLGVAVAPAMLMYVWYAFKAVLDGNRFEFLALALAGLAIVVWAFWSGVRTLLRQRRARARASQAVAREDWLVVHSPRDEAMRLLEAAVAVHPTYVSRASAYGQLTRFGTLAGVIGTLVFLYFTSSYFAAPIIEKVSTQDFGPGLLADFTFLLVIPIVFGLIYGAVWLFAWIAGARALSAILNMSIHGGIVGAAYGGDDAYALTGVTRVPPYLAGVSEERIAAANLGGIDENAIIETAREFYASVVSDEVSDMAFGDPDLLWKRLSDALYHNAYMRDGGVVEVAADHFAERFRTSAVT